MFTALFYLAAVLTANLTATLFMPFPIFGQVAVGTLIFGLTFTQRDRLHRFGRPVVYRMIGLAAVLTLLLLLSYKFLWGQGLVLWLEARGWLWLAEGMRILREGTLRVIIASITALVLAESVDTEVFHRARQRSWLLRVLRSNAVSIPVDSLVFNLIAFAGIFPWGLWWGIVFGEVVVKSLVATLYALGWIPFQNAAATAATASSTHTAA